MELLRHELRRGAEARRGQSQSAGQAQDRVRHHRQSDKSRSGRRGCPQPRRAGQGARAERADELRRRARDVRLRRTNEASFRRAGRGFPAAHQARHALHLPCRTERGRLGLRDGEVHREPQAEGEGRDRLFRLRFVPRHRRGLQIPGRKIGPADRVRHHVPAGRERRDRAVRAGPRGGTGLRHLHRAGRLRQHADEPASRHRHQAGADHPPVRRGGERFRLGQTQRRLFLRHVLRHQSRRSDR